MGCTIGSATVGFRTVFCCCCSLLGQLVIGAARGKARLLLCLKNNKLELKVELWWGHLVIVGSMGTCNQQITLVSQSFNWLHFVFGQTCPPKKHAPGHHLIVDCLIQLLICALVAPWSGWQLLLLLQQGGILSFYHCH